MGEKQTETDKVERLLIATIKIAKGDGRMNPNGWAGYGLDPIRDPAVVAALENIVSAIRFLNEKIGEIKPGKD